MNGRTCQLCGKPLSRIWAGSGGDFCSREHRNQYRLRCGMDTLLEANKHASLMRRRDQPKQFPAAQLQCNSAITPRIFGPAAGPLPHPLLRHVPAGSVAAKVKIETGESHFLPPRAAGSLQGSLVAKPRWAPAKMRRIFGRIAPLPVRSLRMPTALARAEVTAIRFRSHLAPGVRRSFVMLAQTARPTLIPGRAFRALDVEPVGKIAGKRARTVKFAAKVGNAFRVSGSTGFLPRQLTLSRTALAGPAAARMKWPDTLALPGAAYIGRAMVPSPEEMDLPIAAVRAPRPGKLAETAAIQRARAVSLPASSPQDSPVNARSAGWRPAPDGQQLLRKSGLRAGQTSVAPVCIALKLTPAGAGANHRVERAPFEPQEQAMINMSYSWNASR